MKLKIIKYFAYLPLFCALLFYIYKISFKYFFNPDVSFTEKSIQASTIPLPAITICSPFMMKKHLANSRKFEEFQRLDYVSALNLSVSEQNFLAVKAQACSMYKWKIYEEGTQDRDNFDIVKLLDQGAPMYVLCMGG